MSRFHPPKKSHLIIHEDGIPLHSYTDGIPSLGLIRIEYLTTPVATSMKHPTKRPVDGGFPEGSLLTFDIKFGIK